MREPCGIGLPAVVSRKPDACESMPPGTFSTGAGCVACTLAEASQSRGKLGVGKSDEYRACPGVRIWRAQYDRAAQALQMGQVWVRVAVILLGSSSSMPSTSESSHARLLASLRLDLLASSISCGHLFVSLLSTPTQPLPSRLRACPLPANINLTNPGKPGLVWGRGTHRLCGNCLESTERAGR